jgi:hypothetical protein
VAGAAHEVSGISAQSGGASGIHDALLKILKGNPDVTRRLRAMWALHVTGGLTDARLNELLQDPEEYLRAWAIQLHCEDRTDDQNTHSRLAAMAQEDSSPVVRLYLASALRRGPWPVRGTCSSRHPRTLPPPIFRFGPRSFRGSTG